MLFSSCHLVIDRPMLSCCFVVHTFMETVFRFALLLKKIRTLSFTLTQQGGRERTKRMVRLTRQYAVLVASCLLLATMMSTMTVLPTAAFAQSVPNQARA